MVFVIHTDDAVSILFCPLHMLVAEVSFSWPAMSATVVRRVRTCVENVVRFGKGL
jgi:hypothetical protein